jgi:glycosyltransferase involved in cell wall biosynthesis
VIGRISEQKGLFYLLEAMTPLCQKFPHLRLLLVGDGELRKKLFDKVREKKLGHNVIFCGQQDSVASFIDISEFTVMSSLWEGLPGSAIESLMLKKTMVGTMVGGIPEVITHGKTGLLVPPRDPEALHNAIAFLFSHPETACAMGEQGSKHIKKYFALSTMMQQYERYYRKIIFNSDKLNHR